MPRLERFDGTGWHYRVIPDEGEYNCAVVPEGAIWLGNLLTDTNDVLAQVTAVAEDAALQRVTMPSLDTETVTMAEWILRNFPDQDQPPRNEEAMPVAVDPEEFDPSDDYNEDEYFEPYEDEDEERVSPEGETGSRPNRIVHNYSFTPDPLMFVNSDMTTTFDPDPKTAYLGYELETDNRGYSIRHGLDIVHDGMGDYVYCKSDSSINGFEIVSVPMTLAAHQTFNLDWLKRLANYGYRSWYSQDSQRNQDQFAQLSSGGQCGIHVHISKSAFDIHKPFAAESTVSTDIPTYATTAYQRRVLRENYRLLQREVERTNRNTYNWRQRHTVVNGGTGIYRQDGQLYAAYARLEDAYHAAEDARDRVESQIQNLTDMLENWPPRGRDRSSRPQGTSHLWRFTQLIMGNVNNAQELAGRNNTYASFHGMKRCTDYILGKSGYVDRGAVNLQTHSQNTIEVRMFRGSLKAERLLADLEFVQAAMEYTKHQSMYDVKGGALSWKRFVDWVCNSHESDSDFSHLAEYMKRQSKNINILLEEEAS